MRLTFLMLNLVFFLIVSYVSVQYKWPIFYTFILIISLPSILYWLLYHTPRFSFQFPKKKKKVIAHESLEKAGMTKTLAYQILELSGNPSEKQIEDAYKRLIFKNHPDNGGSTYLAKMIIEAKNILMKDINK